MTHPEITRSKHTIHNPADPRHHMRIRPTARRIRIMRGDAVLAETTAALKVSEAGHDLYDTVVYVSAADVGDGLSVVEGKTTHCPLKGDATYYALPGGEPIAWSYDSPLAFASDLSGHVAFYPDEVSITETGPNA